MVKCVCVFEDEGWSEAMCVVEVEAWTLTWEMSTSIGVGSGECSISVGGCCGEVDVWVLSWGSMVAVGDCGGVVGLCGSGVCWWGFSETTFSEAAASGVASEAFSEVDLSMGNSPE